MAQEKILEIEECLALLKARISQQPHVEVALLQAKNCVLAEDVYAEVDVPPYPKSAMDGYAVCTADLARVDAEHPAVFPVIGHLMAGDYEEIPYQNNTAVRVMTGAFIPAGYDAVIKQEDTDYGEETVTIYAGTTPYRNYCKKGEDIEKGQLVLAQNTRLTPLHIGLLAEIGRSTVTVYQPVKVAILCTGSELVNVGFQLSPGKIYNSISYILESAIRQEGLEVVSNQLCADEEELLVLKMREALAQADIVITTGGVSVGQKDLIPVVLQEIGADILFRRANIQPGTPTTGSAINGKIILSLSGNPYAALVNFDYYFWQLIALSMNHESFANACKKAIVQTPYEKKNSHRRFLRAKYEDGKVSMLTGVHASSVISNLTECNCYIDLEAGRSLKIGDEVTVMLSKF